MLRVWTTGERGGGGRLVRGELLIAISMTAMCVMCHVNAAYVDRFVCLLCDSRLNGDCKE